jgi:lipase chaperone LimK
MITTRSGSTPRRHRPRSAASAGDLLEDKEIRDHYEFWLFTYNTGNPIALSADVLRHSLEDAVKSLGGVQADRQSAGWW